MHLASSPCIDQRGGIGGSLAHGRCRFLDALSRIWRCKADATAGSKAWQSGARRGRGLWEPRATACPGDRVADTGTGDGIGQVQGIAGGKAVDAVGIEEVPVLVGGIAAGEEDVEVRVRAPRTALASGSGVACPAEDLAGRDVLAEQAEIDRLGVGTPVTGIGAAARRVLGAAGGEEVDAVG